MSKKQDANPFTNIPSIPSPPSNGDVQALACVECKMQGVVFVHTTTLEGVLKTDRQPCPVCEGHKAVKVDLNVIPWLRRAILPEAPKKAPEKAKAATQ